MSLHLPEKVVRILHRELGQHAMMARYYLRDQAFTDHEARSGSEHLERWLEIRAALVEGWAPAAPADADGASSEELRSRLERARWPHPNNC